MRCAGFIARGKRLRVSLGVRENGVSTATLDERATDEVNRRPGVIGHAVLPRDVVPCCGWPSRAFSPPPLRESSERDANVLSE